MRFTLVARRRRFTVPWDPGTRRGRLKRFAIDGFSGQQDIPDLRHLIRLDRHRLWERRVRRISLSLRTEKRAPIDRRATPRFFRHDSFRFRNLFPADTIPCFNFVFLFRTRSTLRLDTREVTERYGNLWSLEEIKHWR